MKIFEGERLVFIGAGGGSDGIQAAILSQLSGKPSCVISIRAEKTSSQDPTGEMQKKRSVENHGGEVAEGVYRMTPESRGSGRFLEFIPASLMPVYLVVDKKDGRLTDQIQAALSDFGGVESVIGVDTGGDALYRTSVSNQATATPDQDLESLEAIGKLKGVRRYSVVLAPGIDSPPYAHEVLAAAQAEYFNFDEAEVARILQFYKDFEMDGSNPLRFGKTPFAWQAALRGERGEVILPIPQHLIDDEKNPWNPRVNVTDEMAGGYAMSLEKHLAAVHQYDAPAFYTAETIRHTDGIDYTVIDCAQLNFEAARYGKKTKPTLVRIAKAGEEIVTLVAGVEESRVVASGGEPIFINRLADGAEDAFIPRDAQGVSNGRDILDAKYELIGGDIHSEGAVYRPKGPPSKILHEIIDRPAVIKDAWGEGKHAFLDTGATLKLDNGRVTGIAKASFDETWSLTDAIGRIENTTKTAVPER